MTFAIWGPWRRRSGSLGPAGLDGRGGRMGRAPCCVHPPDVHRASFTELDPVTAYRIFALREQVFVVEQDCVYADLDGRDLEPGAVHWWVEAEGDAGVLPARARRGRPRPDREGGHRRGPPRSRAGRGAAARSAGGDRRPTRPRSTPRPTCAGGTSASGSRCAARSSSRTASPTCRCSTREPGGRRPPQPPDRLPLVPLASFVLVWSSGYIAGPYGVDQMAPITLVAWRFGLAAVLAAALAWVLRGRPVCTSTWCCASGWSGS